MSNEKQKVAISSVIASVALTIIKIVVGVLTGSLGILAEAAHSAIDLIAAIVTFFAVRLSDKPADMEHTYGHGKIESFSALIETALLLVTCGWIIYEVVERLFFGKTIEVTGTFLGIGIMVVSIIIDFSRARVLKKVAKKYGSLALEADALHFSSDMWSSFVVIGGLICIGIGDYFKIPALHYGDALAAMGVSVFVIIISIKLGKKTIDTLLDTAPKGMVNEIINELKDIEEVLAVQTVRVRHSSPNYFIDILVGINRNENHMVVHSIVHKIRERLQCKIPNSDIIVSTFPVDVSGVEDKEVYSVIKKIIDRFPNCTNLHNIHVFEVLGRKNISIHVELKEIMTLNASHKLSHNIGEMIQEDIEGVDDVTVNFEQVKQKHILAEDITAQSQELLKKIISLVDEMPNNAKCHDMKIYSQGDRVAVFLHCELHGNYTIEKIESISKSISAKIKKEIRKVESVHMHVEPINE